MLLVIFVRMTLFFDGHLHDEAMKLGNDIF